jgi:hypothetical protein
MSTRLPGMGVLIRRLPVRVRNVSASGCLLETADSLPEGAVGLLELVIEGERHVEALRVNRSTRIAAHRSAIFGPQRTSAHVSAKRRGTVRDYGRA